MAKNRVQKFGRPLKKTKKAVDFFLNVGCGVVKKLVFFFDEARFGLRTELGKRWGKRGEVLTTKVKQCYENFYVYQAVSPQTGEWFSLFLPGVNTEWMNLYLEELSLAYPDTEILILWDGAGWHRSKALKIPANIEIIQLPPYSPELNPIEGVWKHARCHVTRNRFFANNEEQHIALQEHFISMTAEAWMQLCHCGYL